MVSKAKWGISYSYLLPGNEFLHKSEENRVVFVDPLQSHCRWSCVTCTGCWPQPHLPVPLLTAHQLLQPAEGLCGHLPTTIPGRTSQVSQYWLFQLSELFGSFLLRWVWIQLQQQAISSAVAEVGLKSAKRGLQGAGAAWRHHLLIWPQSTWKGCTDTRWVSLGKPSSN